MAEAEPSGKYTLAIQHRSQIRLINRDHPGEPTSTAYLPYHLWSGPVSPFVKRSIDLCRTACRVKSLTVSLWQIVLTFVAVRSKNTIQVIAVTLFNYALLGYGAIMVSGICQSPTCLRLESFNKSALNEGVGPLTPQIYELRKILGDLSTSLQETDGDNTSPANAELLTLPLNVLTYVVIAILAVGCVAMTALAWRMRQEFG